jgi:hypothetical protein
VRLKLDKSGCSGMVGVVGVEVVGVIVQVEAQREGLGVGVCPTKCTRGRPGAAVRKSQTRCRSGVAVAEYKGAQSIKIFLG